MVSIVRIFFIFGFLCVIPYCAKKNASWEQVISQSENQKVVSISMKELGSVPDSIDRLGSVEELQIPFNSIVGLPPTFGKLTHLRLLNLYGNPLIELPDSFFSLAKLEVLLLGRTKISKLDSRWTSLQSLQVLALDESEFTFTEEDVRILAQLKNLRKLDLTQCRRLKILPANLGALGNLEELSLQKIALEKADIAKLKQDLPKVRIRL